jgi:NAD(P)-dependent dehydrogenase (short-subunit alcohol dehydrogenase family)
MSDAGAVRTQLAGALEAIEPIDAVIVCAAISPYGPMETTALGVFRRTLEINCISDIAIFQASLPALRATKGRIIFITSMAGKAAMPFIGAYVASKFALEGAADVMRREAKPQGVEVVIVEPGGIRTGMVSEQLRSIIDVIAGLSEDERERYGYLYRAFQALATQSHTESASTPEQVADVVVAALDEENPAARYIAGDDAKGLLGLAQTSSDTELDAIFAQMYGAAAG